jgi:AraC-like DNA-binding protein
LLRDRKLSLVDVAFACGYADQSHLSRFFKRFVGVSPGKYRGDFIGAGTDMRG